ncbi:MAG: hypothetical protein ACK2U1_06585 [Anaerolineales bacterium]|jgi:hypothetical protein
MANWHGYIGIENLGLNETQQSGYGPVVTFSRPAGTEWLRMVLFGGVGADWNDSRLAAWAYIWANIDDWVGT